MVPDIDNLNGVDMGDIASINGQDAPSGGGAAATTAPSVAVAGGGFGVVTATITKSGGGTYTNPNYSAVATLADSTVTVTDANVDRNLESDKSHISGVLNFSDTYASAAERTLTVRAQEFGATTQSSAVTGTYTPSYIQNKYIRIQQCNDAAGTHYGGHMSIYDMRFFTGHGQSGTSYPTTNLSSNTSETGIVASTGFYYGAYDAFNAFNSTTSWYWALTASAANTWVQIEFTDATYSTKPIIKSMDLYQFSTYLELGGFFKITGSDNADASSPDFEQVYPFPAGQGGTRLNLG